MESKVDQLRFWELIFVRFGGNQTEFDCECPKNVPGNTIIFAIGIAIAKYQ